MAKARAVLQQPSLFTRRQVGKPPGTGRTADGKKPVAIDAGESHKRLVQLLPAHALDRVAPKTVHFSDHAHVLDSFPGHGATGFPPRVSLALPACHLLGEKEIYVDTLWY